MNPQAKATVRKDGSKWIVERDGTFLRRVTTKRLAVLTGLLLDGDISVAPAWYRATLDAAKREHRDHRHALSSAKLSAYVIGLGPADVRADPAGNPTD